MSPSPVTSSPAPPSRGSRTPRNEFTPTAFYNEFSATTPPVLRVEPGDTIRTVTIDAAGTDYRGVTRGKAGNPQTGPFYVVGAAPGDTVAVWGCGPVGQFAIASAFLLGAERVIAIDRFPERLAMAAANSGAEPLNYEEVDLFDALREITGGRGPDSCIDAVGMEAHGTGLVAAYDRAKQAVMLETDRPLALREAIMACRNGGTVSVPGVYGGFIDKMSIGSLMNRGLTLKTGQTHVHRYLRPLLERIENGDIDPSFVITHRMRLEDAAEGYRTIRDKIDDCIKVVMTP